MLDHTPTQNQNDGVRTVMQRRLLLLLLDQGYVQGRSGLMRKLGIHMLSHYLGHLDNDSKQIQLRSILLDLHTKQHDNQVQLKSIIH